MVCFCFCFYLTTGTCSSGDKWYMADHRFLEQAWCSCAHWVYCCASSRLSKLQGLFGCWSCLHQRLGYCKGKWEFHLKRWMLNVQDNYTTLQSSLATSLLLPMLTSICKVVIGYVEMFMHRCNTRKWMSITSLHKRKVMDTRSASLEIVSPQR